MRYAAFILLCTAGMIKAQHFGPVANGHYSGIHAAKINPALTAYSAYNWHINLIGAWGNVNNNYLSLHVPYSPYRVLYNRVPLRYQTENGNPEFDSSWVREHINTLNKHAAAGAMIYGPSFTIKIKRFHIGLVTEATALARLSGMSESLAHAFYKELDTAKGAFRYFMWDRNNEVKIHKTTLSANAWMAAGANISYSIPMKWKQELLIGATLKKVWGFGGGYFQHDNMVVHRVNQDSITLDHTNIRYTEYGNNGRGSGADIGVAWVYHRPEYRQAGGYQDKHTLYQYKFGLSLLDIGRIRYRDAYRATIINQNPIGWNINNEQNKFENQEPGAALFDNVLNELPNASQSRGTEYIGLPTRLAATADYQIKPHWFLNTTVVQSLRSRYGKHARHQSYAMVAPRYETDFLEFSLPVFLEYDYRSLRAGASVRLGPLYLGTNSLLTMVRARGMRDADFYIGLTLSDIPGKWKERWLKEHENKRESIEDCEKM